MQKTWTKETVFSSPTYGRVPFGSIVENILTFDAQNEGDDLRVSVGTDSEEVSDGVKYVAVIHVWRVGKGAHAYYFIEVDPDTKMRERKGTDRYRERIYKEVMMTATLAVELRSALHEQFGESLPTGIEVHADVGESGGTKAMLREVRGILAGFGFADEAILTKPDAYAASSVADRAC